MRSLRCLQNLQRELPRFRSAHPARSYSSLVNDHVRIVEVGPRDGLQNEKKPVSVATKLDLIDRLSQSGLGTIEAGAFVSPKWVPQMADSDRILSSLVTNPPKHADKTLIYQWLLPNVKGLDTFLSTWDPPPPSASDEPSRSPDEHQVSIFLAATESFSKKNTNCSIAESVERFRPLVKTARDRGIIVRAYISVALGCPFEGRDTPSSAVVDLAATLLEMGADEISVADTTGMGTAPRTRALLRDLAAAGIRNQDLALHFHDTYGQALLNVLVALEHGVRTFDASVGGLGGCPFSPGATGNLATEDLVYTLHSLGVTTGVDLDRLVRVGQWVTEQVGRPNSTRAGKAILSRTRDASAMS